MLVEPRFPQLLTVWTPTPETTVRVVPNRYTADRVTAHYGGTTPHTKGLVLHTQQGDGDPYSWFSTPTSQASSTWWVGKDGRIVQYGDPDTERFWAQAAGNWDWHSVETEGFGVTATIGGTTHPATGLTPAQVESVALILAAGHERYGWPLAVTNTPATGGLGWHGMGATAGWGHPYCPGDLRRAQLPAIVTAANQREEPVITANGWPIIQGRSTFTTPSGLVVTWIANDTLARLFSYVTYRWHCDIEPVTVAYGGRSVATNRANGGSSDSNHLSCTAIDVNGAKHPYEAHQNGPWHPGFTPAGITRLRAILAECRVLQWGGDYPRGYRDAMHIQVRSDLAHPGNRVITAAQLESAAAPVIAWSKRVQASVGATPDGFLGAGTYQAIKAWQASKELTVDGSFGPASQAAAGWGGKVTAPPVKQPARPAIPVDGKLGPATIRAWQTVMGTPADGVISQPVSSFTLAIQRWLNRHGYHDANGNRLAEDGQGIGPNIGRDYPPTGRSHTIEALQRAHRLPMDGRLSQDDSQLVRAVQRDLNR